MAIIAGHKQLVHRDKQHVLDQNNGLQRPPTGNLEASRAVCDTLEETVDANRLLTLSIFSSPLSEWGREPGFFNHLFGFEPDALLEFIQNVPSKGA